MNALTHEQARDYLHLSEKELRADERAQLQEHLAGCAECRAYAKSLAALRPALARAMHARWDEQLAASTLMEQALANLAAGRAPNRLFDFASTAIGVGALVILAVVFSWVVWSQTQNPVPADSLTPVEGSAPTIAPLATETSPVVDLPSPTPSATETVPVGTLSTTPTLDCPVIIPTPCTGAGCPVVTPIPPECPTVTPVPLTPPTRTPFPTSRLSATPSPVGTPTITPTPDTFLTANSPTPCQVGCSDDFTSTPTPFIPDLSATPFPTYTPCQVGCPDDTATPLSTLDLSATPLPYPPPDSTSTPFPTFTPCQVGCETPTPPETPTPVPTPDISATPPPPPSDAPTSMPCQTGCATDTPEPLPTSTAVP